MSNDHGGPKKSEMLMTIGLIVHSSGSKTQSNFALEMY